MQSKDKRPSKVVGVEDQASTKPRPTGGTNIGQLKFGEFKKSSKRIGMKQYFSNQETEVFCMRFDQEDNFIAAGCADGTIKIYNLQTNKLAYSVNSSIQYQATPTTCLRWRSPTHTKIQQVLISVNSDGSIIHWHAASGKPLHRIMEPEHSIMCLDSNQSGSMFATAGKDFHVRVYDEDTKSVIVDFLNADWNQPGHSNRVFSLKFLPDNPCLLISSGWDSNVHIWDIREKQSVGSFYGPSVSGDSLDYKNGEILTGSYRNKEQLQIWDFGMRKLKREINWEYGIKMDQVYIYCAQFSKTDNTTVMAGCSGMNELKLFDVNNDYKPCASILEMKDSVYTCDYGNKGDKFAFGGGEGVVYLMTLSE